ncbi:hypothetical protein [Altererythrobacter aquiaggeris]|uniref:hypothetical protein n=1 Tax=Aestuarierythrobacter aquiaggeris TaxID=1898396 RepID=UPI003015D513
MRLLNGSLCAGALFLLAACSAEPGTGPAGQTGSPTQPDVSAEKPGFVRLSGESVRTTGADGFEIPFGTSRQLTETAIGLALGDPQSRNENLECGAGPMQFSDYKSGLTLNFQSGNLVGWTLRKNDDERLVTTAENVAPGTGLAGAMRVYKLDALEESTLGEEFATDEGIGLFVTDAESGKEIESLYAGTNCFFR